MDFRSAWQCLNKINDIARIHNYYPSGLTHTWVQYYKVTSSQHCINEWDAMEDLESQRPELLSSVKYVAYNNNNNNNNNNVYLIKCPY